MNKLIKYIILMILPLITVGCRHKDLEDEYWGTMTLHVVFDWEKSPEAHPASMALYLYNVKGGKPLRYVFQNSTGGDIKVPYDNYIALCINNDNTDWAELRNTDDLETFEVHSAVVSGISTTDMNKSATDDDMKDDNLVVCPQMLWSDSGETISLSPSDTDKTLTMYPDDYGCRYIIDIYDIDNPDAFAGKEIFATFSGLADGFDPGTSHTSHLHVTMPLTMKLSDDGSKIHGEFVNFGQCPDIIYKNELQLHSYLTDGSAWTYNFDVTDQAHNASDPRNVYIVLRGLPTPKPINNGGGLRPVVDDWMSEHYDLKM